MTDNEAQPEFSVVADLGKLSAEGRVFSLAPSEDERAAIAKRLDVIAVNDLSGEIRLTATAAEIVAVGHIKAQLTRECVSSLEELEETIDESFEVEFLRNADAAEDVEEEDIWNMPEIHEGQSFDVGELLVQQLSLAMDPFPRKEGATSLADLYGKGGETSPFAALKDKIGKNE